MDKAKKRTQPGRSAKTATSTAASTSSAGNSKSPAKKVAKASKSSKVVKKPVKSPPAKSVKTKASKVTEATKAAVTKKEEEPPSQVAAAASTNEYEYIEAIWDDNSNYGMVANKHDGESEPFHGIEPEDVEEMRSAFDNAATDCLVINIWDSPEDASEHYSTIFGSLKYDILEINLKGPHDYSDFFLSFFPLIIAGRDLSGAELKLTWDCKRPQNVQKLRQALQLVPRVNELNITYHIEHEGEDVFGEVFDDDTLRHLVTCATTDAKLDATPNVTPEGVLAAFEAYCAAPGFCRTLFHVKDAVIDRVYSIAAGQKDKYGSHVRSRRRLDDATSKKSLGGSPTGYSSSTPVIMARTPPPNPTDSSDSDESDSDPEPAGNPDPDHDSDPDPAPAADS